MYIVKNRLDKKVFNNKAEASKYIKTMRNLGIYSRLTYITF